MKNIIGAALDLLVWNSLASELAGRYVIHTPATCVYTSPASSQGGGLVSLASELAGGGLWSSSPASSQQVGRFYYTCTGTVLLCRNPNVHPFLNNTQYNISAIDSTQT